MKDQIICYCRGVKKSTIEQAIHNGAKSLDDIRWVTDSCKSNDCGEKHPQGVSCDHLVADMIQKHHGGIDRPSCSCCG